MNCPGQILQFHESMLLACFFLCLAFVFPVLAKTDVDFDPNLDFARFKTFAFIGGVENLVMLPVNPELIDNRVHRAATREMTAKGLREVQPNQNPDLVVRYWASASQQVNVATMGNWGPYGAYVGSYWGWMYDTVSASSSKEGSLILDLIDAHSKTLAWRLYLTHKLSNSDKDWKKADEEFTKAFENYPPSDKEKDAKRKERSAHPPKNDQP